MTVEITLTKGHIAIIDDIDADLLALRWFAVNGYATRKTRKSEGEQFIKLHNTIIERKIGRPLVVGEIADHKDLNRLNCTRDNLRVATRSQNAQNVKRDKRNKSGYKGVYATNCATRWAANISVNGRVIYLGRFDSPEAAHSAYCEAGRKYFGEFFNPG